METATPEQTRSEPLKGPVRDGGTAAQAQDGGLYEIRRKIYPRAVSGRYAQWRWALVIATQLLYYGVPWLTWNGRQAFLCDLVGRKFYFFGLVFWPQDVIYLSVVLILSAFTLFLFTAVAGRLWCGYACPQTVYTEIFLWIERKIEGDRLARQRLDASPRSLEKFVIKALKHSAWFAVAFWTGYTFVGYFTPIRELGVNAITWQLGGWEAFWIVFYGFATYGNAGFMREQVCKYMCPYARFQSVMFDRDTLVITYDQSRGEPRGSRPKSADPRERGLGDCVDCGICVQVCPTGIDIRKGLQYECIGCAACIDGCNQVMDKMGYARGLIRYTTQNALASRYDWKMIWKHMLRARTLIYAGILIAGVVATGTTIALRNPLKVDILRDRGSLAREVGAGVYENVYRVQIMNTDEKARSYTIRAEGIEGLQVTGVDQPVAIEGAASRLLALRLQLDTTAAGKPAESVQPGTHKIEFVIQAVDDAKVERHEKSSFIIPR
ncbi:MAG TPA: cytochrome c oxidase accessory protein CcoG [Casimicrobiaceae bacterium]|nr:cytochrome c oxidase accessory protein CcoG [Casimicrobiaceae bacterium]